MRQELTGLARVRDRGLRNLRSIGAMALALLALVAISSAVLAQVSANHDLSWHVIAGGGGRMESGSHTLAGTAGQPAIGLMAGAGHTLCSGFWCGVEAEYRVYLPLVLRGAP